MPSKITRYGVAALANVKCDLEQICVEDGLSLLSTPLEILFQFDGPQVDFRVRQT
jgi:hypothetical protein